MCFKPSQAFKENIGDKFWIKGCMYAIFVFAVDEFGEPVAILRKEGDEDMIITRRKDRLPSVYQQDLLTISAGTVYVDQDGLLAAAKDDMSIDKGKGCRVLKDSRGNPVTVDKCYQIGRNTFIPNDNVKFFIVYPDVLLADWIWKPSQLEIAPTPIPDDISCLSGKKIEAEVLLALPNLYKEGITVRADITDVPNTYLKSDKSRIYFQMKDRWDKNDETVEWKFDGNKRLLENYEICPKCHEIAHVNSFLREERKKYATGVLYSRKLYSNFLFILSL